MFYRGEYLYSEKYSDFPKATQLLAKGQAKSQRDLEQFVLPGTHGHTATLSCHEHLSVNG